jgi:hypothetical protein
MDVRQHINRKLRSFLNTYCSYYFEDSNPDYPIPYPISAPSTLTYSTSFIPSSSTCSAISSGFIPTSVLASSAVVYPHVGE